MFYETATNQHGMKYDPFKALVVPRPIGWVSTISDEGHVDTGATRPIARLGWAIPLITRKARDRNGMDRDSA